MSLRKSTSKRRSGLLHAPLRVPCPYPTELLCPRAFGSTQAEKDELNATINELKEFKANASEMISKTVLPCPPML
jgi:hypothetical protein